MNWLLAPECILVYYFQDNAMLSWTQCGKWKCFSEPSM